VAKSSLSLLQEAVRFAAKAHRGQDRDGSAALPYFTHPIDVMNRLRYDAGVEDEEILAVGALHDVVEECGVGLDELAVRFGSRVAGLVGELTRSEPTAEEIASLSEAEVVELRSRMLLADIAKMSPEAQLVKLADRASNLNASLKTRSGEKRARYVRQSYLILETIPREVSPVLWDGIQEMLKGV